MSKKKAPKLVPPICPYCGSTARLVDSFIVYGRDGFGRVWLCPRFPSCDSYVGCHRSSGVPLGRMADKKLREAKNAAHRSFDPLWKAIMRRDAVPKSVARDRAYRWLAARMGIHQADCHVGHFDVSQCLAVVTICAPYQKRARRILA